MTPLVETCDHWHVSEIADTWDGSIVSVVVLRRDLVCSFYLVRLIEHRTRVPDEDAL
jgi:hypothetical protein